MFLPYATVAERMCRPRFHRLSQRQAQCLSLDPTIAKTSQAVSLRASTIPLAEGYGTSQHLLTRHIDPILHRRPSTRGIRGCIRNTRILINTHQDRGRPGRSRCIAGHRYACRSTCHRLRPPKCYNQRTTGRRRSRYPRRHREPIQPWRHR